MWFFSCCSPAFFIFCFFKLLRWIQNFLSFLLLFFFEYMNIPDWENEGWLVSVLLGFVSSVQKYIPMVSLTSENAHFCYLKLVFISTKRLSVLLAAREVCICMLGEGMMVGSMLCLISLESVLYLICPPWKPWVLTLSLTLLGCFKG